MELEQALQRERAALAKVKRNGARKSCSNFGMVYFRYKCEHVNNSFAVFHQNSTPTTLPRLLFSITSPRCFSLPLYPLCFSLPLYPLCFSLPLYSLFFSLPLYPLCAFRYHLPLLLFSTTTLCFSLPLYPLCFSLPLYPCVLFSTTLPPLLLYIIKSHLSNSHLLQTFFIHATSM